jgi:hypothetical protein
MCIIYICVYTYTHSYIYIYIYIYIWASISGFMVQLAVNLSLDDLLPHIREIDPNAKLSFKTTSGSVDKPGYGETSIQAHNIH